MKKIYFLIIFLLAINTANAYVTFISATWGAGGTQRILWFNSNTAFGQGVMAQLRYTLGGDPTQIYTGFVPGVFDDATVAGANFRVVIPISDAASGGSQTVHTNALNIYYEGAKSDYGTTNNGFEYTGFQFLASGPLPVNIISFDSEVTNNQSVKLIWKTASETNNQYFDVQRSTNGKDFTMIGRVNGKGNTQETISYEYSDNQPKNGINYYRLKQVDFNGKSEYSKIIAAQEISGLTKVYPNPVKDILQINDSQVVKEIEIIDFSGKIFYKKVVGGDTYDVSAVPAGNYILLLKKQDNSILTERIIKN
ncbi:MAG: T9SS type A sorting domain-containing protein [Cytophagaceae bacterium]|nr:T9SS type A sorting domain-containing protein [Cytophagaceae bacterium]